ncbi:unnamed protein product [Adineta ricciae]|nr:unnamed protein product [Adineta ricciae]
MVVSHILEHGSAHSKIVLYFESLDVNNDGIISREDLEACLPHTVESQQLIQKLLRQWDLNRDGHVSLEDFEGYINSNPHLLPMFAEERERVRLNSVSHELAVDSQPYTHNYPVTRDLFVTSK